MFRCYIHIPAFWSVIGTKLWMEGRSQFMVHLFQHSSFNIPNLSRLHFNLNSTHYPFGHSWIYTILIFKSGVLSFIVFNPDSCIYYHWICHCIEIGVFFLVLSVANNLRDCCFLSTSVLLRFVLLNYWGFVKSVMETGFLKIGWRECARQNTQIFPIQ